MINRVNLTQPNLLGEGLRTVAYPTERFDLRAEVTRLLVEKGLIDRSIPLEQLHKYVSQEDMAVDHIELNNVTKSFYETSSVFREIYFDLIKWVSGNFFGFDFLFQETPTIRFHFPVNFSDRLRAKDGVALFQHVDSILGHPLEEINCWLPLTRCYGANALQIGTLDDGVRALAVLAEDVAFDQQAFHTLGQDYIFNKMNNDDTFRHLVVDSCKPVPMEYGELIFFDPRCLHGPEENDTEQTRVSLDFRLIPVDSYEKLTRVYQSIGRTRRTYTRGDVYFEKSALEL